MNKEIKKRADLLTQQVRDEFTELSFIPYRMRANLEFDGIFYPENFSINDKCCLTEFYNFFNKNLFKMCALKTMDFCDPDGKSEIKKILTDMSSSSVEKDQNLVYSHREYVSNLERKLFLSDGSHMRKIYAGFSCATAIARQIGEFRFDAEANVDIDADSSNWDSAFFSSLAIAGGAEWEQDEKFVDFCSRKKFWEWYALTAVPESLNFSIWNLNKKYKYMR